MEIVLSGMCWIGAGPLLYAQEVVQDSGKQFSDVKDAGRDKELGQSSTSAGKGVIPVTETSYRIGPEDVLQIAVFKEADFTAPVLVRTDGKISIPLLNDVQAGGLTPTELAVDLQERLGHFLKDPKVTVVVTQMNSRRAYVMGMVNRQGMVRLLANSTVLQALSAAGGLAPFARSKQIYVLRGEGQEQRKIAFNYDAVIKGKHPEQNIVLEPGDTVVVP